MWALYRADGELRALLATYCDDLLILGIGEDAAATIDPLKDIVMCGDYTDLLEGRFVSVQFDVSTTGMFCHQHDYVASLVLPCDMAGSDRRADKPLPVGSTHEDDTSPLLSAAGVKVFRGRLRGELHTARCRSYTLLPVIFSGVPNREGSSSSPLNGALPPFAPISWDPRPSFLRPDQADCHRAWGLIV
uniref:Reverse transcriptase Ty1/copia-type domain-containing protein n=1 Tax=Chromera velia CCMP2878 TaxID=1169474 RepID=A0A0G4HAK7_9ALVE|eukprot:Cvel_25693.t1-p1 / transcript=Cvel_25693.t1 / gene=Cvel_25693 / organism=Chromera_velia_CCMP2878 / gene_product=hypothetical protein / transcript_product=hypothetical protein / location=Cvel_scaffold2946:21189-21752(+) / protein_length=188 / sequence_SO=supercontig / SO=protein_coding / is_pseudo=false